eukprot:TRINITY_DN102368_c0_g1_i1.p1 TRINITY_DN102368_c0_g1~~TRINITY_DN102368_c0_g1_i1.p1  ORF type:complete len:312 (+),score=37.92 TRINITY_DN102368_c0_g1_i1:109-936(+)
MASPLNNELKKACEKGDLAEATRFLNKLGKKGPHVEFVFKQTPLYYAAWKGHVAIIELLMQKKAMVDHLDKAKNTPLVYAVACGHFDCVQVLVENGANVEAVDSFGKSILDYARKSKKKEIVEYITQKLSPGAGDAGAANADDATDHTSSEEDLIIKAVIDEFHEADGFSEELKAFAVKHCGCFEDAEEHKLEYTILYNEFQQEFESRFEALVKKAATNMAIEEFQQLLMQQTMATKNTSSVLDSFIDAILGVTDYQQFVDWMLDAKQELAESSA